MAITPEQIAELRLLHEAATPVPWGLDGFALDRIIVKGATGNWECIAHTDPVGAVNKNWRADARFLQAMRNALPALLDAAEENTRLREALKQARALLRHSQPGEYTADGEPVDPELAQSWNAAIDQIDAALKGDSND